MFHFAADLVAAVHLSFILFVALGGCLVFCWRSVAWAHVPSVAWGVMFELAGWTCPLTRLENLVRQRAHLTTYNGDFLAHGIHTLFHVTRSTQVWLGISALVGNLWLYWRIAA